MVYVFWGAVAVLVFVYFGYPLLIMLLSAIISRTHKINAEYTPAVSLIIPAYNEEACIAAKLENALALDYPAEKLQIIVSSDNSSDRTAEIVGEYVNRYPARIFFNNFKERSGKMGVLNKSVPLATGEILVFTDANAMYEARAIRNLVRHFADPHIGCVSGAKIITKAKEQTATGEGLYWKLESLTKKLESRISSCAGADGAAYAIRRELYPYPDAKRLVMDDFVVSLNIIDRGFRCIFDPEVQAFEDSAVNLLDEFRRKGRIFAGALSVILQMPRLLSPHKYQIFAQLWFHKILRWLTFVFLVVAFFANILLTEDGLYRGLLVGQALFHLLAVLGFGCALMGINKKVFYVPFYFDFMAFSQIFGIVQFCRNHYKPAWEKLQR